MKISSTIKFAIPAVVGILTLGLVTPAAFASTTVTTTFVVTATVPSSCVISATALGFGSYTGVLAQSTSTVIVQCTNTTPYTVGLNQGTGANATVANRLMTGPNAATLGYSLFSDTLYSVNWNYTGAGTVGGTGNGAQQKLTVYGQIPAGQYVAPGSYSDTITASVTY